MMGYMNRPLLVGILGVILIGSFVYIYRTPTHVAPTVPAGWAVGQFGGVSLRLELATTTTARELGLGGRTSLPSDYGMLFVFPKADRYGFWMKDTLVSLDIFWLDTQGQVIWMAQDVQPNSYPNVFYPSSSAISVLETNAGFAALHAIATGTPLVLQK